MASGANPFGLPPEEAIRWFREKGYALNFDWRDMWGAQHARAFTVAKATQLDVLADIREAVDKAIASGTTLRQFRKELKPTLQSKGWWGEKEVVDPQTGEKVIAQLGSANRLRTIYEANLRQAQSAGRYERMQRTKDRRPYARYVCIDDGNTRPEHWAWHGLILPIDDPWWSTHWPPNGWGCRCKVVQLSDRDLERYGFKVGVAPPIKLVTYVNERTGEVTRVPKGIDPNFDYNPGLAPRGFSPPSGHKEIALRPIRDFKSYGLPSAKEMAGQQPPERWPHINSAADIERIRALWQSLFKGDSADVTDPTGTSVTFGPQFRDYLLSKAETRRDPGRAGLIPRAKDAIEAPTEIWMVPMRRADGSVVMRKRYIKVYSDENGTPGKGQLMIVERQDDGNAAYTTYARSDLDSKREGYLLWPR